MGKTKGKKKGYQQPTFKKGFRLQQSCVAKGGKTGNVTRSKGKMNGKTKAI